MTTAQWRIAILLAAFLFALGGYFYKSSAQKSLQNTQTKTETAQTEIRQIRTLKRLWNTHGLESKLDRLKASISPEQLRRFDRRRHRLNLEIEKLEGRQLNRFLGRIGLLPLQVEHLTIERNGRLYRLECQCKW